MKRCSGVVAAPGQRATLARVNQELPPRHARHFAIAIALLFAGPSCAEGMSGPMGDDTSPYDSGTTYEAGVSSPETGSPPKGGGADSSTMSGDDDGSTGSEQDSSTTDPDAQAADTGTPPPPQDSSTGPQDSSLPGEDAMTPPESGPPSSCAEPSTPAACHACSPGPTCQANGCYNGYVCNTQTNHCGAPGTCP